MEPDGLNDFLLSKDLKLIFCGAVDLYLSRRIVERPAGSGSAPVGVDAGD